MEGRLGYANLYVMDAIVITFFRPTFAFLCCVLLPLSLASADDRVLGMNLQDTQGNAIAWEPRAVNVFCFLGTECPLARLYGPRLQQMADEFSRQDVNFIGINSNVQDSAKEIEDYVTKYEIRFPVAMDSDQSVADHLNASRTPEVVVTDQVGVVRYQGRIDDQYEPGISRAAPTKNDLRDAITAMINDQPIKTPKTNGVGCLITRVKRTKPKLAEVTFTQDIAPILNQHCVECHRDGEIAPFSLTEYDEVVGWADMMLEVIDQRRMPPWHADPEIGEFVGQRLLPEEDRDRIAKWIAGGMAEGDPGNLPESPKWIAGWHLGVPPEIEIDMRKRPFRVPEDGIVEYQYFVADPGWDEDRWVRAAQVVPGNASVVHHAIVFVRPPDEPKSGRNRSSEIGWLGAYVPGQRTVMLPQGHARRVPAGSKLIFQMHYTPNGRAANDLTKVGIWFADSKSVTHEVVTHIAINHNFEIPPGAENYQVSMSSRGFPDEGRLLGVTPHMHLRGKSFRMVMNQRDGNSQPLLHVPDYDFNWQHWYAFQQPIALDDVRSLNMSITFDNSAANPTNPAPDEYVTWGDQTWEEMAIAFFDIASPVGKTRPKNKKRRKQIILPSDEEIARRKSKVEQLTQTFLSKMDKNGDGVVTRQETPQAFRRFGFRRMDFNRDGRIDADEVRSLSEQRL